MTDEAPWPLTRRFDEALAYAAHVHEGQVRKGTGVPYLAHLLGVCALVLEDGGSEEEAIAALLHDAVEDAGGAGRLWAIRRRFGERVAGIVAACSDTDEVPRSPWKERKRRYLAHLVADGDPGTRRVAAADKLHNATAILRDYRRLGEPFWERFSAPAADQIWYYRALVDGLRQGGGGALVDELERVVDGLERLWRERTGSYTNK